MENYQEETLRAGGHFQNHHNRIFAKGRSRTYASKVGDEELDPSKDEGQG